MRTVQPGLHWGTNEMGTNGMGVAWVLIGGPMRWGTNAMGDQWDGGSMRWGTSEMGDQWDGGPIRWGTNEMGDQWWALGPTDMRLNIYVPLNINTLSHKHFIIGVLFIRPFEKRDVLCRGNVRPTVCPSVRLSVRPSVRPCFPDFSSTCFEIPIWNLVYTFSRWHDMSSLSCITIGLIWPSLQPKVGQTYFLQSRPHKSR